MWYIFPQIAGLGHSETAKFYALKDLCQAEDFLKDPVLGRNLLNICEVLLGLNSTATSQIFGYPDDLKLRSSLTLFSLVKGAPPVFSLLLDRYFEGEGDARTVATLALQQNRG